MCESEAKPASADPIAKPAKREKNEAFARFRAAYPKRDGVDPSDPARKKFEAAVKSGVDPEAIIRGAQAFAAAEAKRGNVGSRFIPHSATWLNKRTWVDFAPPVGADVVTASKAEADSWRVPVSNWRRDPSSWTGLAWGPAPGEVGCRVPVSLLVELGITDQKAA